MKTRAIVLTGLIVLCAAGLGWGQSLSLDHVDGLNVTGGLEMGVPVTFYIRLIGDANTHAGITNGFRVYSPEGAGWEALVGEIVGLSSADFDGGRFTSYFSVTGSDADTVGFGAFRMFSSGLPAGYDDIAFTLQVGPLSVADEGKTFCLDSSYYPPSGIWKWAGPNVFPAWDGPHCYAVGEAVSNPQITCPGDTSVFLCDPGTVCFPFDTTNAEWVTASTPAYIDGDQVCLLLSYEDSYETIVITLVAGSGEMADTCTFSVTSYVNFHPIVGMSGAEYTVAVCDLSAPLCTEFHVESSVADMVDTTFSIPGYVDGTDYCFVPDTTGLFDLTIIAVDACGDADTNNSLITVVEGEPAVVECPQAVTDTICGAGMYCVLVSVSPDTARVTVFPSGTYIPATGQLCVNMEESGNYNFTVIAATECGTDSCNVSLDMTVITPPSIECPGQSPSQFLADPGEVCIDVGIIGADSVSVSYGTWSNGQLCFQADTTGLYTLQLVAVNSCSADTCLITPFVQVGMADFTTIVRPDPMRMVDAYRVDPISAMVYLGNLTDAYTVADVNPASVVISGVLVPTAVDVIPDYAGFAGEVLQVTIPAYDFIEHYMPLYDSTMVSYTVSGQFTDGVAFTETGMVRLIGLLVGDVNLDGQIDIADLIYLIDYQFQSGPAPLILETADMDGSKFLDISDLMMLIDYMFEL